MDPNHALLPTELHPAHNHDMDITTNFNGQIQDAIRESANLTSALLGATPIGTQQSEQLAKAYSYLNNAYALVRAAINTLPVSSRVHPISQSEVDRMTARTPVLSEDA